MSYIIQKETSIVFSLKMFFIGLLVEPDDGDTYWKYYVISDNVCLHIICINSYGEHKENRQWKTEGDQQLFIDKYTEEQVYVYLLTMHSA